MALEDNTADMRGDTIRVGLWKGSLVSLGVYAAAVLLGIAIGLWFIVAAVPVFQVAWSLFCGVRILQLRRASQTGYERESYGFALGGLISSFVLLASLVVASQAIST